MLNRYSRFTTDIASIYKNIQKIKKMEMEKLNLKGTHVTCISILLSEKEGLTAAEISALAKEDKAGISRALSQLEEMGYIRYVSGDGSELKRKYRAKAILTEKGQTYADQVSAMIVEAVSYGGESIDEAKREIFYEVLGEIAEHLDQYVEKL